MSTGESYQGLRNWDKIRDKLSQRKAAASARVAFFSKELAKHSANRPNDPALSPTKSEDAFQRGSRVYYKDADHGWQIGTVHRAHQGRGNDKLFSIVPGDIRKGADDIDLSISAVLPMNARISDLVRLKKEELTPALKQSLVPVRDLTNISQLHEAVVLQQVKGTFERQEVYTRLGPNVLLSLNPGQVPPEVYSEEMFQKFIDARGTQESDLPPHIWGAAHQIFWQCLRQSPDSIPQALIFTGAPGAGKTEAANLALRFLTSAAATQTNAGRARELSQALEDTIMRLGPVVDSFGNATLHRYTNSSRMTKWTEVFISQGGALVGGRFEVFMLERSRIVSPPEGERSFHAFYHLLAGIDYASRRRLGLDDPRRYEWLFRNVVVTDEDEALDASAYKTNRKTLADIGLAAFELEAIDKILAGIIHLRSINVASTQAVKRNIVEWSQDMEERVRVAASLWGIEPHLLFGEVASVTTATRDGIQTRRLRPEQAEVARNRVCIAVYCSLVEWVVKRINAEIACGLQRWDSGLEKKVYQPCGIGLLDLFGYEDDKTHGNNLEQLIMNAANDEMQKLYTSDIFAEEVHECEEEGLDMLGLVPPDTTPAIDLLKAPPKGVFVLLNEQSKQQGSTLMADQAFLGLLETYHKDHPCLRVNTNRTFGVRHSTGMVWYGPVTRWRIVNASDSKESLVKIFRESTNSVVKDLFNESTPTSLAYGTVCTQFINTMNHIQKLLKGRQLSWCRCIRPDHALGSFNGSMVLEQLLSAGVIETIRVRRNCYPVRLPHDYFLSRYRTVLRGSSYDGVDGAVTIPSILKFAGIDGVLDSQVGNTKVFLKDVAHSKLEGLRVEVTNPAKMVTNFIAAKLAQKANQARGIYQDEPLHGRGGLSLFAAQQSMRVLATHLPVFLAYARGYLAHHLVRELMAPPEESSDSDHVSEMVHTVEEDRSYLERGILARSAPLRKLAEWKKSSLQAKAALDPPPPPVLLDRDSPLRHPNERLGNMPDLASHLLPSPGIDQSETHFKEPNVAKHDYQTIILKEADTLNKMAQDELFELLGQGRREVHAPLRLSKSAIEAIKRLVAQGMLHERHCERAKKNKLLEIEKANAETGKPAMARPAATKGGFPDSLGPLMLHPCQGVVNEVRDGRYSVPLEGPLLPLVDAGVPGEGRVSPSSLVTLPQAARRRAGIPRLAHSFVWAYPLPGINGLSGLNLDTNHAAVTFVTYGGFIYLDEEGAPLSVNALSPGSGLSFNGPYRWTQSEQTLEIELSGRMQPITIKQLSDIGAKYFCWLKPEEELGISPCPTHGGFVYLFREPSDQPSLDDRYFTIVGDDNNGEASKGVEMDAFKHGTTTEITEEMVELPRIEGVKELEGVVVHRRTAQAINEVIESDMEVQRVRLDMEPLNTSIRVSLLKQNTTVPFNEPAVFSPVRHHTRRAEEFVDYEGGYYGWDSNGMRRPTQALNYDGNGYPFPNGISTQLSPLRSQPFFIHAMPANFRTAFGKSVDGKAIPVQTDDKIKSTWVEMYEKGLCGGAKQPFKQPKVTVTQPPAHKETVNNAVRTAYGVFGKHAGHVYTGGRMEISEADEKATRYLETIKHELDRQK
eukprot:TRINITY_DN19847_c0_g2_i7.p1 TRINITY_DN19847_c0_g2~~TRINITY_DN19847_c0_g2_i7.p1  ORF type:complete len:1592 (+),score=468.24 TRINITY_DN19847_c0_g2_i7:5214-9989(+)